MTHRSEVQPCHTSTRPGVWEDGLSSQERTLAVLLEHAFRIKEEVAAGLRSTQGSVQAQALSCKLLENHIVTITHIVKQISLDIQTLQRQVAQRDHVTTGTSVALQSLDQKNAAGIGDLRGRVARCDASLCKLSADVNSGERRLIGLKQEVADLRSAVDKRLNELEGKCYRELGRLEASLSEHCQDQRSATAHLSTQVRLLEDRMSGGLEEAKKQTDSLRKWTEERLNSSAQTQAKSSQQLQDNTAEAESRLAVRLRALEARVEQFEARRDNTDQLKRSDVTLIKRMKSVESSLHQEVQLLKQEYHKGFLSVHDAIESLRQIGDIKSRLDMEKLQKDIRHICRKVEQISGL